MSTLEAVCRCGARRYPSQSEAFKAEPNGAAKCPTCSTFARDHDWRGDWRSDDNPRCYDCDTRWGSHGGPR